MRAAQITVVAYGPDPKTALARVLSDVVDAVEADDETPITLQVRVGLHEPAADPPPLDRLGPPPPAPLDARFVAEGKVWCHRRLTRALPKLCVPSLLLGPAPPHDEDDTR